MNRLHPAIAIFITAILAYGLLIPSLGFYWDDLPMSWIRYELGPQAMTLYFSSNRPVWGMLYQLTTQILPHVPVYWQIFALLLRALTGILFFAFVRRIWHGRDSFALIAAFIFLLYPGFNQQWGSYLYSHFFIVLNFFLASLYFNLRAIDEPQRFRIHTGLALLFSALNLWMMEYFFFLELVRPFLIFFAIQARDVQTPLKQLVVKAARISIPYLLVWIADLIFRFTVFNNTVYTTSLIDILKEDFLGGLTHLTEMILASFWTVSGSALAQIFHLPNPAADGPRVTAMVGGVVVAVFIIARYAISKTQENNHTSESTPSNPSRLSTILFSFLALFFAGWPFWLIDFPPALGHPTSRFTLPFMVGVSLLVAGLLDFIPWARWRYLLAGILIALCAGRQVFWSNDYRLEWDRQTNLFWQMTWRAPGLAPDTTVLLNDRAFLAPAPGADPVDARVLNFYADNSLAASLNWVYDPNASAEQVRYVLFYPKSRIGNSLPSFEPGLAIDYDFLAAKFHGNTSQVVAFFYAPPGCLRLLDPDIDVVNRFIPDETLMREAAGLSSSAWIMPGGTATPPEVFGSEPEQGWCFYFEKADLARQESDWEEVVRIANIAFALDDHPNDPVERFVYIEGYAHVGEWARAQELSVDAWRVSKDFMGPMLCRLWDRIALETKEDAEQRAAVESMREKFVCTR